jgi:hypothetical protein
MMVLMKVGHYSKTRRNTVPPKAEINLPSEKNDRTEYRKID